MNDYSFGNFLYALRSEKGISQTQLGEMLGVTNKAVSKWENGSTKPNTNLLPRIAEIFNVTVEELFACKRMETNSEYEKIKRYLSTQKKRYAILSSVFLSAIIILPLLLIEFICVVMGFHLPDDVAGPLGAVGFILSFVSSLTAFIIYRKNFKQTVTPSHCSYSQRFVEIIKKGLFFSAVSWLGVFVLLFSVYLLVISFSSNSTFAHIFLSVAVFVLIVLLGTLICFAHIKHLLQIKFSKRQTKEIKRIRFSELPIWGKVCYIGVFVFFSGYLIIRIGGFFNKDRFFTEMSVLALAIALGCELALILYTIKKK